MTETTFTAFSLSSATVAKVAKAANDWRAAVSAGDASFLPMADAVFAAREEVNNDEDNANSKARKAAWKALRDQVSLTDAEVSNAIRSGMVAHILDIQKIKLGKKSWRTAAGHNGASLSTLMTKVGVITTGKIDGRTDDKVHAMSADGQEAIIDGLNRWFEEDVEMTRAGLDRAFRDENEEEKTPKTPAEKFAKVSAEALKLAENSEVPTEAIEALYKELIRAKTRREA
tara:strand:- start:31 stop:717 length:687 start_codon:yes stop_codon:yes gene_type:complete